MLTLLLTLIITSIITTFLGYWVHWIFHQEWSKWFYNAHMNHHKIQYPPANFFSEKYKSAGRDSTVILFAIAFAPIFIIIGLLTFFGILSITTCITAFVFLLLWGFIHDHIHDQFHITNTFWEKFPLFVKWRTLHYIHHIDMNTNFGIIQFQWDKLFKTFVNENITITSEE